MTEIFKIQCPLSTTEDVAQALVYNQDRSIEFFMPMEWVSDLFEEDILKLYVRGRVDQTNLDGRSPLFRLYEVLENEEDW